MLLSTLTDFVGVDMILSNESTAFLLSNVKSLVKDDVAISIHPSQKIPLILLYHNFVKNKNYLKILFQILADKIVIVLYYGD